MSSVITLEICRITFSLLLARYDGARGMHPNISAQLTQVPLLKHVGPWSMASSGCGDGQGREEELFGLSLLQQQGCGDRKGTYDLREHSKWKNEELMIHLILSLKWHSSIHVSS